MEEYVSPAMLRLAGSDAESESLNNLGAVVAIVIGLLWLWY